MFDIPAHMYPPPHTSWFQVAAKLPADKREALFRSLRDDEAASIADDWMFRARREQLPPPGDWFLWMIVAGRGFGKNFAGSNVFIEAHRRGLAKNSGIVAATVGDLRKYCIDGPSGIISLAPKSFQPKFIPSRAGGGLLEWPNGSTTNLYTSEKPRRARGANLDFIWCDELSWWQYPQEMWDNLMFGLRFGRPRIMVTMTPRPIPLVKELVAMEDGKSVIITRGSTYDNIDNLATIYIDKVIKPYEGTTLGRQELGGELLMDVEGALWNHEQIERLSVSSPDRFDQIIVAVDPSTSSQGDECGIVSVGRIKKHGYVLGDHSLRGSPGTWARKAITVYHTLKEQSASALIVAEKNQGGEMVSTILNDIDSAVPVRLVHASVGKVARAEPVAAIYEQNRVSHCGHFPKLEDEMCLFVPGEMKESPNRVDALVWGMTYLLIKSRGIGRAGTWGRVKKAA